MVIILSSLFILGMVVKAAKDHFSTTGTDQITLIGTNEDVVDFYAGLGKKDIELVGKK